MSSEQSAMGKYSISDIPNFLLTYSKAKGSLYSKEALNPFSHFNIILACETLMLQ